MYAFWSSVMLTTGRYKGNPVVKHLVIRASGRICSNAGSRSSMKPAASCLTKASARNFASRPRASPRA